MKILLFQIGIVVMLGGYSFGGPPSNLIGKYEQPIVVFQKLFTSELPEQRVMAISDLSNYAYLVSDEELLQLLSKALIDESVDVRLAAVLGISGNARRVAAIDGEKRILDRLHEMGTTLPHDTKDLNTGFEVTRLSLEAISAIQQMMYYRLSFVEYCDWENEILVSTIKSLMDSDDKMKRYGAAMLSGGIYSGINQVFKAEILRKSLKDSFERTRHEALVQIIYFNAGLKEFLPTNMLLYSSLRPHIQKLTGDSCKEVKDLAFYTLQELDINMNNLWKRLGIRNEENQ